MNFDLSGGAGSGAGSGAVGAVGKLAIQNQHVNNVGTALAIKD